MSNARSKRAEQREAVDAGATAVSVPDLPGAAVATKLTPPVRMPWLLPRDNLLAELTTTHSKLCLINAPAGWGKTSLLAAWHKAESSRLDFAFLHLEPTDDDAPVLWSYVIAALRMIHPGLMIGADEALATPGMEPTIRLVPALINELCEIDKPLVLVLDDYHVVTKESVHASILYFIEHLPPAVRLAIATRADPPFPLGRFRASGKMTEVRADRLRLTEEEADLLLKNRFHLDMDARSVQLLCQRTEGWPAGLHLAGLSLQGDVDHRRFVEQFAGDDRNIADYLTGEVLNRLPEARREFLMRTSVLDRLAGPLCDAVAGVTDSAAMLEELERGNLFLIPLDNRRVWYRYHQLFGEWLRHELHRVEPGMVAELHSRASRWFDEHGLLEPAISHALAADDDEQAGGLIDRYLIDWAHVNWSAVRGWLDQLPDDTVEGHPMTVTAQIMLAWMDGDLSGGLRRIPAAEAAIAAVPVDLRPEIEAMVALFGGFGELVAGDMDAALTSFAGIADRELWRASPAYAMAIGNAGIATFWSIGALEAIPALREGVVALEQASLPDTGATALLAAAYAEIGDWTAAEATAQIALRLPCPYEENEYPFQMPAHYALGQALLTRDEHEKGIAQIKEGLEQARSWVEPIFIAYGCLILAHALSDYSEKRALVREARQLIEGDRGRGRITELVAAAERKLALRRPSQRTGGVVHVEPLTDRELDVLRLLPSDLSLREISNELYLSHNTIKSYTKSIYRKLGVTSRAAAVEEARALDLA